MNPVYFAFESNLSEEQMRRRCPSAALLGRATLRGYRLAFAGFSVTWNGPVATVLPARDEQVPGVLYRLSPEDLARLDHYEGAPFVYTRRLRRVFDPGHPGRRAHVYELADEVRVAAPSLDYVLAILRGYRLHGLSLDALCSALAFSREQSQ